MFIGQLPIILPVPAGAYVPPAIPHQPPPVAAPNGDVLSIGLYHIAIPGPAVPLAPPAVPPPLPPPVPAHITAVNMLLALQWPLALKASLILELKIHGLWPCKVPKRLKIIQRRTQAALDVKRDLSVDLRKRMVKHWPNLKKLSSILDYEFFWEKEWKKHGQLSGLSAQDYFSYTVDLYEHFLERMPPHFGLVLGQHHTVAEINNVASTYLGVQRVEVHGHDTGSKAIIQELRVQSPVTGGFMDSNRQVTGYLANSYELCLHY